MALTDSLISYWRLDEASGGALDAVGANHLTQTGSVGTAAGKITTARDFPGGANYFSHADNADLSTGDVDFTFSCWAWLDAAAANVVLIGKDEAGGREYTLDVSGGNLRWYFQGGTVMALGPALSAGQWYHIVAWHDSVNDHIGLDVNGVSHGSGTGGGAPVDTTTELRLGARAYSGAEGYLDGRLDEVGLWKRVLTAGERAQLYNGGAGLAYPFTVAVPSRAYYRHLLLAG